MASLVYSSAIRDVLTGAIDFDTDTFRGMLVPDSYFTATTDAVKKDSHTKRSDVTEIGASTGYTAGGAVLTATVAAVDTTNDRVEVSFSNPNWPGSTISARGLAIYKSRGGAASADELVALVDFGTVITSTNGTFTATFTSNLRFQN